MSTQPSSAKDPIFDLHQSFIKASREGDIQTLVLLGSDDIVCMSPNDTTLYGKDEWKAWWEEYFQFFRISALTESDRDVVIAGDYATEIWGYMIAIVPESGTRFRDDGRFLTIWKRQADDSWKIWQIMWNSIKPIGSGTNRYMSRLKQKKASKS